MKTKIKIAGAGLSGLTCAINLKKAGFNPEVFETQKEVGAAKNGDWQGFENWTEKTDILERLGSCGLEINFEHFPFYEFPFYSYDLKEYVYKSQKPIFYLVKRGAQKNYLDYSLKRQAEGLGIKINFNHPLEANEADIISSGGNKPWGIGLGINFSTNIEKGGMAILDDTLAPKVYSYFLAIKGQGTIVSAFTATYRRRAKEYLEKTIDTFKKLKKFSIDNEKRFAGVISFGQKPLGGKIFTGEAGGYQDYLLGFGMYFAVRSGFLGAKAIIEDKSYNSLIKKEFSPLIKTSKMNRFIFEKLGNRGYKILLNKLLKLTKKRDFQKVLHFAYTHKLNKLKAIKKLKEYAQNKT